MRTLVKTAFVIAGLAAVLGGLVFVAADHDKHIAVLATVFGYWNAAHIHEATHGAHIIIGAALALLGAALAAAGMLAPAAPAQYLNKPGAGAKDGTTGIQE